MRLLILGGGNNQLNAIKRAVDKGHQVVLTDYFADAPGSAYATFHETISTFDIPGNQRVAEQYGVDGVMTMGTDQPVYTAARVAHALDLPRMINIETAEAVTNKKSMKRIFTKHHIPTVKYQWIHKDFAESDCEGFRFPVVLKPLDSQGQRGIYKLYTPKQVKEHIQKTLSFSRQEEALLEEYYESDEITVSCWVEEGIPHILTVTDRESFERGKHIGICYAHEFPSRHIHRFPGIEKMVLDITRAFNIPHGPLYIQLLVGENGILANEVACRIGGAYEEIFIPHLTGVDILELCIENALGNPLRIEKPVLPVPQIRQYLSVQLFFSNPGFLQEITPLEEVKKFPGVISAGYNIRPGRDIPRIKNATARAGYMIITGSSRKELSRNVHFAAEHLKLLDDRGGNLIIKPKDYIKIDEKDDRI